MKSVPEASQHLKLGLAVEQLDAIESRMSDLEAPWHGPLHGDNCSRTSRLQEGNRHERDQEAGRACMNPTEAEQGSETQIRKPSLRLISGLDKTICRPGVRRRLDLRVGDNENCGVRPPV